MEKNNSFNKSSVASEGMTGSRSSTTDGLFNTENPYPNWATVPNKKTHQYVVGIDLGHGETSAAYAEIGWDVETGMLNRVKDIDLQQDSTYVIPSAMAICTNGEVIIGEDAFDKPEAEFYVCFKKHPKSIDGQDEQLMIKYMRAVYEKIRECAGSFLTDTNHVVYIATPSGWDKETQDLYGQMAVKAGMPITGVMWESRAALINAQSSTDSGLPQHVDQGAIVFDMGSSTLDFTYIRGNNKPIDFGYNCGASKVEEIMYEKLREDNDVVFEFEDKYPQLKNKLLFTLRKGKEKYYKKRVHKLQESIDFFNLAHDESLRSIRLEYDTGHLDGLLVEKRYIDKIREAMYDYKEKHINGMPIYAAFFTGGASRMDFLEALVKEIWNVEYVFRDQNPSLTISQGVAEAARSDVRSGGAGNIKASINKIMSDIDVYSVFSKRLADKMREEIQASIARPVCKFKDDKENWNLARLETRIEDNIKNDISNVGIWAKECMEEAFEEATNDIRDAMSKKMANYSKSDIKMGKLSNTNIDMPDLDLNIISNQIQELSSTFTESASEWTGILTVAAVGAVAAFLFTGPIGWIVGSLTVLYKAFFGNNETEEEKREKAKYKELDKEQRLRVYNEFENNWGNICNQIDNAIDRALNNPKIKNKVNTQCKSVLREYAEECLRQTRLMLD